jgi:uncharacterized protein YdhG (YjbR/CyaY superfamily)
MPMTKKTLRNFDAYLGRFPTNVQRLLQRVHLTIKKAAPQAKETISYGIPAFTLNGLLVWFAAHKNHIGFYPRASAIAAFKRSYQPTNEREGRCNSPSTSLFPWLSLAAS